MSGKIYLVYGCVDLQLAKPLSEEAVRLCHVTSRRSGTEGGLVCESLHEGGEPAGLF